MGHTDLCVLRVVKNDRAGWEQKKGRKSQVRQEPRRESSKIKVETGQSSKSTKKNAAKKKESYAKTKTRTDVYSLNVSGAAILSFGEMEKSCDCILNQHIFRLHDGRLVFKPMTCRAHTDGTTCMMTCRAMWSANSSLENVNAVTMPVTAAVPGEVTMCRIISISSWAVTWGERI